MIIVSISIKGGAGKSIIMVNLAACLARAKMSVCLIDADPHSKSATRWAVRRQKNAKLQKVDLLVRNAGSDLEQELIELKKKYNYVLVDLHGGDTDENREVLLAADKLIVPFKAAPGDVATFEDLRPMLDELKELRPHIERFTIITEASTMTAKDKTGARDKLTKEGLPPLNAVLHNRQAFKDSVFTGLGVCEMADKKASAEFDILFAEFLLRSNNLLNFRPEPNTVN